MNDKTPKIIYLPPAAKLASFQCRDIITVSGGEDWELPIVPDEE